MKLTPPTTDVRLTLTTGLDNGGNKIVNVAGKVLADTDASLMLNN